MICGIYFGPLSLPHVLREVVEKPVLMAMPTWQHGHIRARQGALYPAPPSLSDSSMIAMIMSGAKNSSSVPQSVCLFSPNARAPLMLMTMNTCNDMGKNIQQQQQQQHGEQQWQQQQQEQLEVGAVIVSHKVKLWWLWAFYDEIIVTLCAASSVLRQCLHLWHGHTVTALCLLTCSTGACGMACAAPITISLAAAAAATTIIINFSSFHVKCDAAPNQLEPHLETLC